MYKTCRSKWVEGEGLYLRTRRMQVRLPAAVGGGVGIRIRIRMVGYHISYVSGSYDRSSIIDVIQPASVRVNKSQE